MICMYLFIASKCLVYHVIRLFHNFSKRNYVRVEYYFTRREIIFRYTKIRRQFKLFMVQAVTMEVFPPKTAKKVVSAEAVKKRIYRAKKKKDEQQKKSTSTRVAACRAKMSVDQRESHKNNMRQAKRHK